MKILFNKSNQQSYFKHVLEKKSNMFNYIKYLNRIDLSDFLYLLDNFYTYTFFKSQKQKICYSFVINLFKFKNNYNKSLNFIYYTKVKTFNKTTLILLNTLKQKKIHLLILKISPGGFFLLVSSFWGFCPKNEILSFLNYKYNILIKKNLYFIYLNNLNIILKAIISNETSPKNSLKINNNKKIFKYLISFSINDDTN